MGGEQRRRDAENHACQDAERQREDENARIEMNVARSRQGGGCQGEEEIESPAREEHAGSATGQREQDAFGEQLPNESGAARAERSANGELAMLARWRGARSRLAMFAQAMSRTQPTAPSNV